MALDALQFSVAQLESWGSVDLTMVIKKSALTIDAVHHLEKLQLFQQAVARANINKQFEGKNGATRRLPARHSRAGLFDSHTPCGGLFTFFACRFPDHRFLPWHQIYNMIMKVPALLTVPMSLREVYCWFGTRVAQVEARQSC